MVVVRRRVKAGSYWHEHDHDHDQIAQHEKVVRKVVRLSGCIRTAGRTAVRTNFCSRSESETWTWSWSYQYEPTLTRLRTCCRRDCMMETTSITLQVSSHIELTNEVSNSLPCHDIASEGRITRRVRSTRSIMKLVTTNHKKGLILRYLSLYSIRANAIWAELNWHDLQSPLSAQNLLDAFEQYGVRGCVDQRSLLRKAQPLSWATTV